MMIRMLELSLPKLIAFFLQGEFDESYDIISRVAPELKASFIYRAFGHIGQNIEGENIGNALNRCFYGQEKRYHTVAFVPGSNRVIIICKAPASTRRDEKTRSQTKVGEASKKQEYLLMMELEYEKSNQIKNAHNLGIFTQVCRTYCMACVAGRGHCRHRAERLWYQYHHWTKERLVVDRP